MQCYHFNIFYKYNSFCNPAVSYEEGLSSFTVMYTAERGFVNVCVDFLWLTFFSFLFIFFFFYFTF